MPERTVVDGVPVFFLSTEGLPRAELIFRVGVADEDLPRRGITHLVEHMAMHSRAHRPDWWRANAQVEPLVTRFSVRGEPEDISIFFSEVTAGLSNLPLDRVRAERAILRTEAASGPTGSIKGIWRQRYGARGLGVADFIEFGLRWLGASEVSAWAEERFTAQNAVLWVSGQLPPNLRLNLREGAQFERPRVEPLERAMPALYRVGRGGVALSMLTSKLGITADYLVCEILDERVRRRLRHSESIAYDANVQLQIGGITAFADALAENAEQAARSLIAVVRELAEQGHRPDELERALASNRAARHEPNAALESLNDAAMLELGVASSTISWDDYDREAEALTAADIAGATEHAFSTALLAIPEGVSDDIDGFTPIPEDNGRVFGETLLVAASGATADTVVSYSDEGISVGRAGRIQHGIEWQDVAAAAWWNDGTRLLVALDGSARFFTPSDWKHPEALLEALSAHVPGDRWIPMDDQTPSISAAPAVVAESEMPASGTGPEHAATAPESEMPGETPDWAWPWWLIALVIIVVVLGGVSFWLLLRG